MIGTRGDEANCRLPHFFAFSPSRIMLPLVRRTPPEVVFECVFVALAALTKNRTESPNYYGLASPPQNSRGLRSKSSLPNTLNRPIYGRTPDLPLPGHS